MTNYYFLASALPPLQIGVPPDLDYADLMEMMRANLSQSDYASVWVVRLYYDIQNMRLFWRGEELGHRGNYNENELEEAILTKEGLPSYVIDYLERYESDEERLRHFPSLLVNYFRVESGRSEGFLKQYLTFERDWRLVLTGFRAKKEGRDLAVELQYEEPSDDLVAQILAQRDARHYEPPGRYHDLKPLFDEYADDPMALYGALSEYRFQKVEAMVGVDMMSLAPVLAYMVRLIIIEKWLELDKKRGMEIVDTIVKEAT